jgi:hypothetical protein
MTSVPDPQDFFFFYGSRSSNPYRDFTYPTAIETLLIHHFTVNKFSYSQIIPFDDLRANVYVRLRIINLVTIVLNN